MTFGNETPAFECRFLNESYFETVLEKFIEAFSDYARPPELDHSKFRNHINLNAVDLGRSVGCFQGKELIGFSLNGFGQWKGKSTVYDAGTGIIPDYRRRGASEAMFRFMIPIFKTAGAEQFLLEVITNNEPAVNLYRKLGFKAERELLLFEASSKVEQDGSFNQDVNVRPIDAVHLKAISVMRDAEPSWQNSNEAILRSASLKTILGAFVNDKCVGYIIFSTGLGRAAQFAVDKNFRGRGIGSRLLAEMQAVTNEGSQLQMINLDAGLTETIEFLEKRGFRKALTQYEMTLDL